MRGCGAKVQLNCNRGETSAGNGGKIYELRKSSRVACAIGSDQFVKILHVHIKKPGQSSSQALNGRILRQDVYKVNIK